MAKKKADEPTVTVKSASGSVTMTAGEFAKAAESIASIGSRRNLSSHAERLPVKLTHEEHFEAGRRLANIDAEIWDHGEHEKAVKKDLAATRGRLESERSRLALMVRTGEELRDVRCSVEADAVKRVAETVRSDTGTVVRTRPLTEEEMQGKLFTEKEE